MAVQRSLRDTRVIRDLRKPERKELCRILNKEEAWRPLGYIMKLHPEEIKFVEKSRNPTDSLLKLWGDRKHTIVELFALLRLVIPEVAAYIIIGESLKISSQPGLRGFPQEELANVTDQWNRSNILGKGGFGTVYRGTWENTLVAIKRASDFPELDLQVAYEMQVENTEKEIKILTSCQHENILTLYGFSFEGQPPCLVYELMVNGSLGHKLRLKVGSRPLNWIERLKIAKGTARGLNYLHTYASRPLIHGDIKSGNILLDSSYEPKIGDFGLAQEGPKIGSTIKLNDSFGTVSYQPDEFLNEYLFSTKIDTYSYGIVLFELATGLRSYEPGMGFTCLKDLVNSRYDTDFHSLQDIKAGVDNQKVYARLMVLGRWCSNPLAKDRPEMELICREFNYT